MGSYTDLPDGATILHDPGQAAPPAFSDLPDGAQVLHVPTATAPAAATPDLSWGMRLKSLLGDPVAQQQVLAASTAAVRNSPAGGVARGLEDPVYAARQLGTHALAAALPGDTTQGWAQSADTAARNAETDYQQNWRQGNTGTDYGRIVGNTLATLPLASALPVGAGLLGKVASGAASGGISGALQPVTSGDNYGGQLASNVASGAAMGGTAGGVLGGLAGAVSPTLRPGARELIDAGVKLTPGQALGGLPNITEQAASSLWPAGAPITAARHATVEEFNRGAINQALTPIGETLETKGAGREAIGEMQDKIGKAYDAASSGLGIPDGSPAAMQLATNLQDIMKNSVNMLPERREQFRGILSSQLIQRLSDGGGLSSYDFQAAKSALGQTAQKYLHSSSADERDIGSTLMQTQSALKDALVAANPQAAQQLGAADAAYAMAKRVQGAATRPGTQEPGVFSPAGLQSSIKQQDRTLGKRAFAAGDALMQPYAEAGQSILGKTVPDSGTPLRQAVQHGIGGAANLLVLKEAAEQTGLPPHIAIPGLLGSYLLTRGLYSPTGRAAMTGLLANRPAGAAPVANAMRGLIPYAGMVAPAVGRGLLSGP